METLQKLERIGRGSFGVVFRCKLIADGTEVVLKQASVESLDEKEREQAQNEVRVLARLQVSPNSARAASGADDCTLKVRARSTLTSSNTTTPSSTRTDCAS
jgi:serine/threonine protein kinase